MFRKTKKFLPPDTHTYFCLSGDKKFNLVFCKPEFWDSPFCFNTDDLSFCSTQTSDSQIVEFFKNQYLKK